MVLNVSTQVRNSRPLGAVVDLCASGMQWGKAGGPRKALSARCTWLSPGAHSRLSDGVQARAFSRLLGVPAAGLVATDPR
jgi:hypothetical protein